MYTCPNCKQKFLRKNQTHSCNDKTLDDFLRGKSLHTTELFHHFIAEFRKLGEFELHPAKSRIGFAAKTRFGYIHQLGKNFVDVVLQFPDAYEENFCFHKIAGIPGGEMYNHYIRIYEKEDVNDEVKIYLKKALEIGNKQSTKHFVTENSQ